jgi:hypothetical protein
MAGCIKLTRAQGLAPSKLTHQQSRDYGVLLNVDSSTSRHSTLACQPQQAKHQASPSSKVHYPIPAEARAPDLETRPHPLRKPVSVRFSCPARSHPAVCVGLCRPSPILLARDQLPLTLLALPYHDQVKQPGRFGGPWSHGVTESRSPSFHRSAWTLKHQNARNGRS